MVDAWENDEFEVLACTNEGIDDLTVLLELPNLETVDISWTMEGAVRSLEGKDPGFELIVEQPN